MRYTINTTQWLLIAPETRAELAKLFGIPRKGNSRVYGGKVLADGYRNEELTTFITVEKINAILETEYDNTDILKAFYHLVDKIEGKLETNENNNESDTGTETQQDEGGASSGDSGEGSDSEDRPESESGVSSGTSESKPKAVRGRKAGSKNSADGSI